MSASPTSRDWTCDQTPESHPSGLRVVVITAYASLDAAVQAVNVGAIGYLKKPFGMSDVHDAIWHALEKRMAATRELEDRLYSTEPRDS